MAMELDVRSHPVVLAPGEGDVLFDGRILIKADFEQLTVTESLYPGARDGAEPHFHRRHADSFYVLEGELAFLVGDEEVMLPAGACVCAPPGLVHGFRSTKRARFLNYHTPDGGFAENLRSRDRGAPVEFDNFDPPSDLDVGKDTAVVRPPGGGERLEAKDRIGTIKIGRDELAMVEFDVAPGFAGPNPHTHADHVDSFYVLDGEPELLIGDKRMRLGPGSFVAAPIGVVHAFSNPGPGRARLLNVHAPSGGFHDSLRRDS
jgi:mannose-6-phosphate isomerase-like protein (cupin superfamily)